VSVLGTPKTLVGSVIAGFWIANAIGVIAAAILIRNRYRSTIIGFVVLSFAFLGAALIHDSLYYAGSIILSGFGLGLIQAFLIPSLHLSGTQKSPHTGIATYSLALSLGTVVGPLAAAVAIYIYGFSPLFIVLALVSSATFIISIRIGLQRSFASEDTRKSVLPSNILRTLRQRGFSSFYALNFLYSLLLPILLSYGGIFAETKFKLGTVDVLALFSITFLISSALRIAFSRSGLSHFKGLLFIGFSALCASFLLMSTSNGFPLFLLGFILFSVPHGLIFPITTFMALETAGTDAIISSTYIFATSSGVAEFVSPLVAVPIIALYDFSTLFLIMTSIAVAGLILLFVIPNFGSFYSETLSASQRKDT
jgi:predicted MFS family arabinose efflux permease